MSHPSYPILPYPHSSTILYFFITYSHPPYSFLSSFFIHLILSYHHSFLCFIEFSKIYNSGWQSNIKDAPQKMRKIGSAVLTLIGSKENNKQGKHKHLLYSTLF